MSSRQKGFVGLVIAAVLVSVGAAGMYVQRNDRKEVSAAQGKQTNVVETDQRSNPKPQVISYAGEAGETALEQLKQMAEVETKESSYGTLVESINGLKNGTGGKYWLFYVNGEMASVGADAYVSNGGEVIEWKFTD